MLGAGERAVEPGTTVNAGFHGRIHLQHDEIHRLSPRRGWRLAPLAQGRSRHGEVLQVLRAVHWPPFPCEYPWSDHAQGSPDPVIPDRPFQSLPVDHDRHAHLDA